MLLNLNTVTHCSYNYEKYYIDESYKQEIPTSLTTQAVEVAGSESGGSDRSSGWEEWMQAQDRQWKWQAVRVVGAAGAAGRRSGRQWEWWAGAELEQISRRSLSV